MSDSLDLKFMNRLRKSKLGETFGIYAKGKYITLKVTNVEDIQNKNIKSGQVYSCVIYDEYVVFI